MRGTMHKIRKNTSPEMEIAHKMALIDKVLRNGYDNAVKYLNDEDKLFLSGIKDRDLHTEMSKWEQKMYALK